jgi:hypothetical protein
MGNVDAGFPHSDPDLVEIYLCLSHYVDVGIGTI